MAGTKNDRRSECKDTWCPEHKMSDGRDKKRPMFGIIKSRMFGKENNRCSLQHFLFCCYFLVWSLTKKNLLLKNRIPWNFSIYWNDLCYERMRNTRYIWHFIFRTSCIFTFRISVIFCSGHLTFYIPNIMYFHIPNIGHFLFRSSCIFYSALPVLGLRTSWLY